MDCGHHGLLVGGVDLARGAGEHLAGGDALIFQRGDAAGIDRLGDEGDGHAHFHGVHHGPLASTLLAGGVEDLVHQVGAAGFLVAKDVAGDLDQVAIEHALVPVGKDIVDLVVGHAEAFVHQLVGLADELHVAIFDAVVDHLHIVTGTAFADPITAGGATLDLGGNGLEDFLHMGPGGGAATRHDARAVTGAFLAAGYAGTDEQDALGLEFLAAAGAVSEQAVAAIDDDVTLLQVGDNLGDELVHRRAGLHQHHHAAGPLELGAHLGNGMGTHHLGALGFLGQKVVHFADSAVVGHHGEAVVIHVEDEVLTHHSEANEGEICLLVCGHGHFLTRGGVPHPGFCLNDLCFLG